MLLFGGELGHCPSWNQAVDHQSFTPSSFLVPHGDWQDAFQGNFQRATVVIRNPAGQLQDFRRQQGAVSEHLHDRTQAGMWRMICQCDNRSQYLPVLKWNSDPAPYLDLLMKFRRDEIIEFLAEDNVQCDACNHAQGDDG
jgi:hypothetical protein